MPSHPTYRPIFFDTETTGIYPERDRIIEIAAYDPVRQKKFEELIHPGMMIPKEVIAIHQITDEMVRDASPFRDVIGRFIEFCEGNVALVAHNSDAFDLPFLRAEMKRVHQEIPSHWLFIDSLKWARRYRKDLPRHSLQYLRQVYGIQENQAHRALNDVMVLFEVYSNMVDDLSCEQVVQLLAKAVQRNGKQEMIAPKTAPAVQQQETMVLFNG